jgi:DNA-binding CsgD family transcriptional regulator/N-acetylneuraminic acid mutarotase
MENRSDELLPEPANTELSERELEILRRLATGVSNKEIAAQLLLNINTVKVHLRNIFAKLNVQSRTEATLIAIQRGWVIVPGTAVPSAAVPSTPVPAESEAAPLAREEPIEPREPIELAPPPIVSEPPLAIGRRLALSAIAAIALGLALIAGPREAAQSSPQTQPFTDTQFAPTAINGRVSDTVWQAASVMSLARGRLAAVAVGQQVIAIGGETATGVTGLVEILDTVTQRWRIGQNKPTPVANVSAVVMSGTVIVPGGYTAAGVPTSIVERYDPVADSWSTLAPLPAPRFAYAIAAYQNRVYVFGGWDGQRYVDTVFIYDATANRWTTGAPLPLARGFSAAATSGAAIYVVGGYADGREFNNCDRYLPADDRWETCAPLLVTRGGLGLVTASNRVYAIGGGWMGYLSFSEWFDPRTNQWTVTATPFVGQWRGMGVAAVGTDIYVLGGWTGQYQAVVEKYNPFPFNIFVPAATR